MPEQVRPAPWLTAILISHVLLGAIYSFSIPMWEAYDEWGHYGYVRFVAEHFRLPNANDFESIPNDERRQPPLYYFITGTLTGWIKAPSDFFPQRNLLFSEDTSAGYNVAVHADSEAFPYEGTALALHAARLVTVLLSALGVWATYHLVSLWLPGQSRLALLAAGLHAFWPQFLFNGSVVTNDLMASVCASLFIVALYGWWFRPPTWRSALGVLLTGGLLALSKFTVYGLVILGGLAFGISIVKHFLDEGEHRGKSLRWVGGILLLVILIGYLVWRLRWADILLNSLMGQWLKYILLLDEWPQHLLQADWLSLGAYLAYGMRTFWASFGWGNLEAPGWTYTAAGLLVIAAIIGWIVQSRRSPEMLTRATPIFLSLGACVVLPLLHAVSESYIYYFPGRYLLSAISPVCALLAAGYAALWPEHLKSKAMLGLGIGFIALAAVLPFAVLLPRYQRPALLQPEAAAEITYPLDLRYGNSLQLVGYTVNPAIVQPGQEIELTLYWRCLQPVPENYILTVKALGPDFGVLDEKYLFPGGGNFATSLWQTGDFFKESYRLSIPSWTYAPTRGQFLVDFLDEDRRFALPLPKSAPTQPQHDWFGEFKVAGQTTHFQPETVTNYRLNDKVVLKGYSLKVGHEQEITLDLLWETLRPLTLDYTVSIRLLGSNGRLWAQVDSPPRAGAYPTHLWDVGERVIDSHRLTLPDAIPCGSYTLDLGVYEWTSQFRLPVTDEKGAQILDRAIKIPLTLQANCL
jgi:hypothetical protein